MLSRAQGLLRHGRFYSSATPRQHDPLNIIFCGSDAFSIYSLRALQELKAQRPDKIAGIEVVCRPDKRVGRGLKTIREVPIKAVANELELKLHQIDTFTGWTPPASINLVVAVSFGLLVPSRVLTGANYGGINVHPSLLPDLRGPAPVVHTLLKQRSRTGVTLQTMHPTKFDHGEVLAQTPFPGIEVPAESTPDALLKYLGQFGAEMLRDGVEQGLFVPPVQSVAGKYGSDSTEYAPKITPEDRRIEWSTWTADEIILRDRVLRNLWDMRALNDGESLKRVVFEGPWRHLQDISALRHAIPGLSPGSAVEAAGTEAGVGFLTCDRRVIAPSSATISGQRKGMGLKTVLAPFR